ncbi:MAG: MarR family winged helix-turn-helix transcriptional regulator [Nitriliruptoraceae bacterium]
MTELDDARRDVGELILRVAARLDDAVARASAAQDLTPVEARLLRLLLDTGPWPQARVARRLALDPSRVSVLAVALEKRGLVARRQDRGDLRITTLRATDDARRRVAAVGGLLRESTPLRRLDRRACEVLTQELSVLVEPEGDERGAPTYEAIQDDGHR